MRIFLSKAIKFFIGVLLLPFFPPLCKALWEQAGRLTERTLFLENPLSLVLGGGVLWAAFALFFRLPTRVYVFAHELTHALFIKLFGGQVKKISIKKDHGFVLSDKSNFVIVLAPYLFPFYAVLLGLLLSCLVIFIPFSQMQLPFWIGMGICLGYHWNMTAIMLTTAQSDFSSQGYFFSFVLIILTNLLLLLFLFLILPDPVGLGGRLMKLVTSLLNSYKEIFVFLWPTV